MADYQLLGIRPGASVEEVKRAFRVKCMEVHPDVNKNKGTEDFARLTTAYNNVIAEVGRATHPADRTTLRRRAAFGAAGAASVGPKFSIAPVAILVSIPLCLYVVAKIQGTKSEYNGRIHGMMNPPVNPFLSTEEARRLPVAGARQSKRDRRG